MAATSASIEYAIGGFLDRPAVRRTLLGFFVVACLYALRNSSPLGWDEAVYSARAKDLAQFNFDWGRFAGPYWSDLRAPGFPVSQAIAFELFGVSDFVARAVVVAFSFGLLVVMAHTLDLWFAPRVGTTAVLLTVLCPGFLATSTLAFADNPASMLAIAAVLVLGRAVVTGNTRHLPWVPVLIGAATTMRFGAVLLVVAPLAVMGTIVIRRAYAARDLQVVLPYAMTGLLSAGVTGVLLTTTILTDKSSPIGAKSNRLEQVERPFRQGLSDLRAVLSPGPVDYGFNGAFWGWSFALAFGVVTVFAVCRVLIRLDWSTLVVAGAVALTPVVLYALTVRQFVTTYLGPLFAVAAAGVALGLWNTDRRTDHAAPAEALEPPSSPGRWALVAVGAVSVATVVVGGATVVGVDRMHNRLQGFEQLAVAAGVANDALGSDCRIATARVPQVVWYSECRVASLAGTLAPADEIARDEALAYVDTQAGRLGAKQGETFALVLMEGLSGQPQIEAVWDLRDPDRSLILERPGGRRVALVTLERR